jgi:hypothetical protein
MVTTTGLNIPFPPKHFKQNSMDGGGAAAKHWEFACDLPPTTLHL